MVAKNFVKKSMMETSTRRARGLSEWRRTLVIWAVLLSLVATILVFTPGALNLSALAGLELKPPDFRPLFAQSALVQFHVYTVAAALVLGPVQFLLPKGSGLHRALGWMWAACMVTTALATLFIRDMNHGQFSPIHIFSVMTLVLLPLAVWRARAGDAQGHARSMIGLYVGLVIAGVTAIAPGRLIWEMFFR